MKREESWGKKEELWGGYQKKGADAEQNKIIDKWVAERNKHIGEITIPQVGEWPPTLENFYGSQQNEWINTDLIRHYAESMGDRNPLWSSQDYARKSVWGGIIAPPMICDSIVDSGPGKMEPEQWRKFNSFIMYPGEGNYEWFQVMRPGDKIRLVQKFMGIKEIKAEEPKPCRVFQNILRKWLINQREETVAIVDHIWTVLINRPAGSPPSPFKGWNRGRRRLTDEERDAIYRGYDNEKRRGADTLYWEDVVVGEESEPLVVGPISTYDSVATYTAVAGHAVGFATQWDRIKLNFDFAWLDTEINAWKCGGEGHIADHLGHAGSFGGGLGFANKCTLYGVRCHAICNWMGDDAFLRRLNHHMRDVVFLGDVLKTKIRVTNKYIEGDEHLVDVEVITENLDGILLMDGDATVRLLSRAMLSRV